MVSTITTNGHEFIEDDAPSVDDADYAVCPDCFDQIEGDDAVTTAVQCFLWGLKGGQVAATGAYDEFSRTTCNACKSELAGPRYGLSDVITAGLHAKRAQLAGQYARVQLVARKIADLTPELGDLALYLTAASIVNVEGLNAATLYAVEYALAQVRAETGRIVRGLDAGTAYGVACNALKANEHETAKKIAAFIEGVQVERCAHSNIGEWFNTHLGQAVYTAQFHYWGAVKWAAEARPRPVNKVTSGRVVIGDSTLTLQGVHVVARNDDTLVIWCPALGHATVFTTVNIWADWSDVAAAQLAATSPILTSVADGTIVELQLLDDTTLGPCLRATVATPPDVDGNYTTFPMYGATVVLSAADVADPAALAECIRYVSSLARDAIR